MLPKNLRSRDMVGREIVLARDVLSVGNSCSVNMPAGSRFIIIDAANGFLIKSVQPCPCCGAEVRLDHVTRDQTCLPDDGSAPVPSHVAYWKDRANKNDYIWTECSNCGFTVENYKAVDIGRSSTDYIRPVYKHCPKCGKRMAVKDNTGRTVL